MPADAGNVIVPVTPCANVVLPTLNEPDAVLTVPFNVIVGVVPPVVPILIVVVEPVVPLVPILIVLVPEVVAPVKIFIVPAEVTAVPPTVIVPVVTAPPIAIVPVVNPVFHNAAVPVVVKDVFIVSMVGVVRVSPAIVVTVDPEDIVVEPIVGAEYPETDVHLTPVPVDSKYCPEEPTDALAVNVPVNIKFEIDGPEARTTFPVPVELVQDGAAETDPVPVCPRNALVVDILPANLVATPEPAP